METIDASGLLASDAVSRQLVDYLRSQEEALGIRNGVVYYDFPLFRDSDDILYRSQVLLATQSHGVLVFGIPRSGGDRAAEVTLARLDEITSQLTSIIFGKLIKSKLLRSSPRELLFPVQGFVLLTETPREAHESATFETITVLSLSTLTDWLTTNALSVPISAAAWDDMRSSLEGAKGLLRPKERQLDEFPANSKPVLLAKLESEVANFDAHQRRAAIQIVDGPQRIRGLAGSGKTIVLAMKAAHLHLNDPSAMILVTFHTKSLYAFLKRLITRFYRQFNDQDPDWDRIHIRHNWGGKNTPGVYYDACIDAGVRPLTLVDAAGDFNAACLQLLKSGKVLQTYDYVLLDEAQDSVAGFFQLCFAITRGGKMDRNVVWAYDELQNIMNVRMKSLLDTFGAQADGSPLMDLDRAAVDSPYGSRDIVLHKCYRNPREVLVTAHALGFGIYANQPVQMLENKEHWQDVGYLVEKGDCLPGQATIITRPIENSPSSISASESAEDIIAWYVAPTMEGEIAHVVKTIRSFINEGLRADDIMVIALDDRRAKTYLRGIGDALTIKGIKVNNMTADPYGAPPFLLDHHVTLTTVYRAKGNEAAVVFAVGVDGVYDTRKLQKGRNKLFTAFTRAKAWLRVSGVGDEATFFFREIRIALKHFPSLVFTYPDPNHIVTLQRDLSDKASKAKKMLDYVAEQFELLDMDEEERQKFFRSLERKTK